jgi:hypothetical protein
MHAWRDRLNELLNRPLFGTKPDSRAEQVNPTHFSEHEFPIFCPTCRYQLRGLPDGRCPECGEEFTRAKLLVEEYLHQPAAHPVTRARWQSIERWALVYIASVFMLCLAFPVAVEAERGWLQNIAIVITVAMGLFMLVAGVGFVVFVIFGDVVWHFLRPSDYDSKREQMRQAALRQAHSSRQKPSVSSGSSRRPPDNAHET